MGEKGPDSLTPDTFAQSAERPGVTGVTGGSRPSDSFGGSCRAGSRSPSRPGGGGGGSWRGKEGRAWSRRDNG